MRKFLWLALAVSLLGITAQAQEVPAVDATAGYSFFRVTGSGGLNLNGVSGSAAYNLNNWLGLVGDFGVYHGSPSGVGVTASTFTFGPRFSYRASEKMTPFVEALFGGAHLSASFGGFGASSTPFAYGFGGGTDLALGGSGHVSLRPEVDYFGLRSNGSTSNAIRISGAIVFHLGQR